MKIAKSIIFVLVFVFVIGSVNASTWVNDPADCPTSYQSQDCLGGEKMCGYDSGVVYCYDMSSLSAPGTSTTVSTTNIAGFDGGYLVDCEAYDGSEPHCDNSGAFWCDRNSSCYDVNRNTTCTASVFGATSCGGCIGGYTYCDGSYTDADGCEVDIGSTSYPSEDNAVYNSTCEPQCSGSYLDCNGNLGSGVDGCEILDGGSCTVGSLDGTYEGCSGGSGNCVIDKSYFETGTETNYSSADALFWAAQYGTGYMINITNGSVMKFGVNNSGCIEFEDGTGFCSAYAAGTGISLAGNTFSITADSVDGAQLADDITLDADLFVDNSGSYSMNFSSVYIDKDANLSVGGRGHFSDGIYADNISSYEAPLRFKTNGTTRMYLGDRKGSLGIGTEDPKATLQIQDGAFLVNGSTGAVAMSGAGTRMMWVPEKAAFRAGHVQNDEWDDGNLGDYSLAAGYNSMSNGSVSIALGYGVDAIGDYSFSSGHQSVSKGTGSTSIGGYTVASGFYSLSTGYHSKASGGYSTAMGNEIQTDGEYSFGISLNDPATAYNITEDNKMSIMGGEVGIGTVSPDRPLEVKADSQDGVMRLEEYDGQEYVDMSVNSNGDLDIRPESLSSKLTILGEDGVGGGTTSGFVGINKTSPTYQLDVGGDVRAEGYHSADGSEGIDETILFTDRDGVTHRLDFENGLLVGYTNP